MVFRDVASCRTDGLRVSEIRNIKREKSKRDKGPDLAGKTEPEAEAPVAVREAAAAAGAAAVVASLLQLPPRRTR